MPDSPLSMRSRKTRSTGEAKISFLAEARLGEVTTSKPASWRKWVKVNRMLSSSSTTNTLFLFILLISCILVPIPAFCRKVDGDLGILSECALKRESACMVLYDAVGDMQPEACPFVERLGGKERRADLIHDRPPDTRPMIAEEDPYTFFPPNSNFPGLDLNDLVLMGTTVLFVQSITSIAENVEKDCCIC